MCEPGEDATQVNWAEEFASTLAGVATAKTTQLFTLMGGLDSTRGGRTRAVISRQRALAVTFGTHLLTLVPQRNLYSEVQIVRQRGLLPGSTSVTPVVPAYVEINGGRSPHAVGVSHKGLLKSLPTAWSAVDAAMYRDLHTLPASARWLPVDQSIIRLRRVTSEYRGLSWIQITDAHRALSDILFSDNLNQVLVIQRPPGSSYLSDTVRTTLYAPDGSARTVTFPELCSEVATFIASRCGDSVIISDVIGADVIARKCRGRGIRKVLQFHGAGLGRLDTGDAFDAVVYPTLEQYWDSVERKLLPTSRHKWIPHYLQTPEGTSDSPSPASEPVVAYLGRMDANKRVGHVLKAFAGVLKEVPTARLRIYGKGPYQSRLERMVAADTLLSEAVEFMGYTSDPLRALADATVSVVTSKHEGFCLSLFESLSVGTPVVSYSFRYGPRDALRDGENGYLVDDGDVMGLRDGIVCILKKDSVELRRMHDESRDSVSTLNEERFLADWRELLEGIAMPIDGV